MWRFDYLIIEESRGEIAIQNIQVQSSGNKSIAIFFKKMYDVKKTFFVRKIKVVSRLADMNKLFFV